MDRKYKKNILISYIDDFSKIVDGSIIGEVCNKSQKLFDIEYSIDLTKKFASDVIKVDFTYTPFIENTIVFISTIVLNYIITGDKKGDFIILHEARHH